MRKIILIPVLSLVLLACKKDLEVENITDSIYIKTNDYEVSDDQLTIKGEVISANVTSYGFVFSTDGFSPFIHNNNVIYSSSNNTSMYQGPFTGKLDASVPDRTYSIRAFGVIDGQTYYGKTVKYTTLPRGTWKKMKSFPGPWRAFPVSFSVNGKGYVGCGRNGGGNLNDMWEYDPATDSWAQIASYPGKPMNSGFSFVIGNKAYVGGGTYDTNPYASYGGYLTFYEFDPLTKTWQQLNDVPVGAYPYGPGLFGAVGFSVGGFGFVTGGAINGSTRNIGVFKFDPASKNWEAYSILPVDYKKDIIYLHYSSAFVLGDLAYVGTGFYESPWFNKSNNTYSWNYKTKEWKLIGNVPGTETAFGIGFTNTDAGYIGLGESSSTLYQFRPSLTGAPFKPVSNNPDYYFSKGGIAFTIGNKTYIGMGEPSPGTPDSARIYEYTHTR